MAVKRDGFSLNINFIIEIRPFLCKVEFILSRIFINAAFHCHTLGQKGGIFLNELFLPFVLFD